MFSKKLSSFLSIILCLSLILVIASCGEDDDFDIQFTTEPTLSTTAKKTDPNTNKSETTPDTTGVTNENNSSAKITQTQKFSVKIDGEFVYKQTIARKAEYLEGYNGMRDVTAKQILLDMGVGYNIANSLDSTSETGVMSPEMAETCAGNPTITKKFVQRVSLAGFGAIRLPINFSSHILNKKTYEIDSKWLDRIKEIVDYIINARMYCIITLHNENSWLSTYKQSKSTMTEFTAIWKQICAKFKNYNDKLLFQCFSDVYGKTSNSNPTQKDYDYINLLTSSFVKTVRASGGNNEVRHLVITTYGSQPDVEDMQQIKVPKDTICDRIIVDIHFRYPPSFVGDVEGHNSVVDWGADSEKNTLNIQLFLIYYRLIEKLNCPVIIGQFYAADKDNDEARARYTSFLCKTAYQYGIICFWYDQGVSVNSIFDRNTGAPTHEIIVKTMLSAIR